MMSLPLLASPAPKQAAQGPHYGLDWRAKWFREVLAPGRALSKLRWSLEN